MSLTYDQQIYIRRTNQDFGVPEGTLTFKSDTFTGDGSTTVFTLSHAPDLTNFTPVVLSNKAMQSGTQVSITGSTLTFFAAPANLAVIQVNYQY